MSTKKDALERAVSIATSQPKLASRITQAGRRVSPQTISLWLAKGRVGDGWAISVAKAVEFRVSPHELDPDGYPNPWDGLPLELAKPLIEERIAA